MVQRVLKLSMLRQSMTAEHMVSEINRVVVHEYGLDPTRCRAFMADGCSANLLALDSLKIIFNNAVPIRCFSHMFNNIGKRLKAPDLDAFLGKLYTLLAHSPLAKALFLEEAGVAAPSTPGHRWGSRYECDERLALNWPGVVKFVAKYRSEDDVKSKTVKWMRNELERTRPDGRKQAAVLKTQLAMMVDVGAHVTNATIFLEGDSPLVRIVHIP